MEVARSCSPDGMARGAVTSKARILSRIALVAVGSTELRRARQPLFRLLRPLVTMIGINTERPSAFEAKPLQSAGPVRDERGWEMGRCQPQATAPILDSTFMRNGNQCTGLKSHQLSEVVPDIGLTTLGGPLCRS